MFCSTATVFDPCITSKLRSTSTGFSPKRLCCCRIAAYSGMYDSSKLSSKMCHTRRCVDDKGYKFQSVPVENMLRQLRTSNLSDIILHIESVKDWIVINSCEFNSGTLWFVHLENSALREFGVMAKNSNSYYKQLLGGSPSPKVFQPSTLWAWFQRGNLSKQQQQQQQQDPTLANDFWNISTYHPETSTLIHRLLDRISLTALVHIILPGAWCTILNYCKISQVEIIFLYYDYTLIELASY